MQGASLALPYEQARQFKRTNRRGQWRDVADDLSAEIFPQVSPSFRLRQGETIFTIGSCFARNIETNLADLGCIVPMLDFRLPSDEFGGSPHAAMNLFHPAAFRQTLEWAAGVYDRDGKVTWEDCARVAFDMGDDRWFDMEIAPALPVAQARFVERRQHIYDVVSSAFRCDCLMMTPGLIEAWRDLETGRYTYGPPYHRPLLQTPERWGMEVLSYQRCLEDLLAAIDTVRARNPAANVLITTSPVPMNLTFTGRDVTIANAYSKAVLRAVCDAVVLLRERIDYFPSYEMATLSAPDRVWKSDRLHVSEAFIGKIVGHMLDNYFERTNDAAINLQRGRVLLADGDFAAAEEAARKVLSQSPGLAEGGVLLGIALAHQKRWEEAAQSLRRVLKDHPDRCDAHLHLARAYAGGRKLDRAVAELEKAIDCPEFSISDFAKSRGILRRLEIEEAVRIDQRLVERLPLHAVVGARLAEDLLRAGREAEALAELRRAAVLSHPPAAMLVQLARMLLEIGENEEARARLIHALAEDPKNEEASALMDALAGRA